MAGRRYQKALCLTRHTRFSLGLTSPKAPTSRHIWRRLLRYSAGAAGSAAEFYGCGALAKSPSVEKLAARVASEIKP
jgi:hypothetical protein